MVNEKILGFKIKNAKHIFSDEQINAAIRKAKEDKIAERRKKARAYMKIYSKKWRKKNRKHYLEIRRKSYYKLQGICKLKEKIKKYQLVIDSLEGVEN